MEHKREKVNGLFLFVNPPLELGGNKQTIRLLLDKEQKYIEDQHRLARSGSYGDNFVLKHNFFSQIPDMILHLSDNPHMFHFSGHGEADGSINLVADDGKTQDRVHPDDLADILIGLENPKLRLVVFNCCNSKAAAEKIVTELDGVVAIGMEGKISDTAAVKFSKIFYQQIFAGQSVKAAFYVAKVLLPESEAQKPMFFAKKEETFNEPFVKTIQLTGYTPTIAPDSVRYSLLYFKPPDEDVETKKIKEMYDTTRVSEVKVKTELRERHSCAFDDITLELGTAKPHLMYLRTSLKDGSIMLDGNDDVDIDYDTVESQIAYTLVSIKEHQPQLKIAIFNTSNSSTFAEEITRHIKDDQFCTIGMAGPISDKGAISFIKQFLQLLFTGRSISGAFKVAKTILTGTDKQAPVMYCNNPDSEVLSKPFNDLAIASNPMVQQDLTPPNSDKNNNNHQNSDNNNHKIRSQDPPKDPNSNSNISRPVVQPYVAPPPPPAPEPDDPSTLRANLSDLMLFPGLKDQIEYNYLQVAILWPELRDELNRLEQSNGNRFGMIMVLLSQLERPQGPVTVAEFLDRIKRITTMGAIVNKLKRKYNIS